MIESARLPRSHGWTRTAALVVHPQSPRAAVASATDIHAEGFMGRI